MTPLNRTRTYFSGERGFALAYFLIVGVLIVMLTGAVLVLGREGLRATRGGVDGNRALAAAESGLAVLIAELERDPEFDGSFSEEPTPENTARYSSQFASPASAGMNDCVNNLLGATAVDSYHGPGTVPPHSALLVVTGRSGTSRRVVEVLVVSGLSVQVDQAITATGTIDMSGNVVVNGWKSLLDPSPVPASFHTNSQDSGVRVRYTSGPLPGARLEVEGKLTSSSASSESAVFQVGSLPSSKLKSRVPEKALPRPNIEAVVADHSASGGPPIPTAPGPVTFGGDNHYSGDVTINGDVTLNDNAGLYVDGNLEINGSILGRGKVVVTQNTSLYGESEVAFREDDYIALMSGGHVVLKGFKGQQFLESLEGSGLTITRPPDPPNPGYGPEYFPSYPSTVDLGLASHNLGQAFNALRTEVLEPISPTSAADFQAFQTALPGTDYRADILQSIISYHPNGASLGWPSEPWLSSIGITQRTHNNAGALRQYMESQGGGPLSATRFLGQRLLLLEDMFRRRNSNRDYTIDPSTDTVADIFGPYPNWDREKSGVFDALQSEGSWSTVEPHADNAAHFLQAIYQFDYDRLGSANFKGIVYTGGAFVATDDVVIRGTVIINGDPRVAPLVLDLGPSFGGTRTFNPGDAGLYGYTTFTYVEELFDDGIHNLAGAGSLDIKRWIAR